MSDFEQIEESKRAFRKRLAAKPVAEKLWLVEELAERSLAARKDSSAELPEEPWSIPSNWRWSRMGNVASVVGGSTPRTDRVDYWGGSIPWITPADLSKYTNKTISKGARSITQAGLENSGSRLLPANSILFSSRAPIGYVAIAANPVATNQGFKSFILGEDLVPDFVYYYLLRAKELAVALASGTTFLEISGRNAARLPVPVPSVREQRRIVAEIEKQFTRLEVGVAALRRVQANLKRYRAALLKAACEGRLVATGAEIAKGGDQGSKLESGEELLARILTERRKEWQRRTKYKETSVPQTASLPRLPKGWTWLTIDAIGFVTKLAGFEYTKFVQYSTDGDLAVIKAENAGRAGFKRTNFSRIKSNTVAQLSRSQLRAGDLLMVFVGAGTGNVARVPDDQPYFLGPNIGMIRVESRDVSPAYLELYLRSPTGHSLALDFAKAVAQPSLSMGTIRNIPVALPPFNEQTRIVAEVERRLSVVEELETLVAANLQRAARLRQSILQKAFSGTLATSEVAG